MYKLLLLIFLMGCSTLKSFRSYIPDQDIDECDDIVEVYDCPPVKPTTNRQWKQCARLCRNKLVSVTTEIDTSYITCTCKGGETYRIVRLFKKG